MSEKKVYWVGQGVLAVGDGIKFGEEIPAVKGFDVAPFLKSGKASYTKPVIESEVVQALEDRFIAARAEVEQLRAELSEVLDRTEASEELEALQSELTVAKQEALDWQGIAKTNGDDLTAALEHNVELRTELDDAKAMIAALTTPEIPGAAGPKKGDK